MTLKKIAIGAAAFVAVAATLASHIAQAGGKGGASNSAPGRQSFGSTGPTEPGKSQFAPGDVKKDSGASNAKELAPGDKINKSKK